MMRNLAAALAAGVCMVAVAAPAQAQTRTYQIPAGSLQSALDAYARQSGRQVIYRVDDVRGARSPGARGNLTADAALDAILRSTGFAARADTSGAIAIVRSDETASSLGEGGAQSAAANDESAEPGEEEIVVTGTRIAASRGKFSPVTVTTRDELDLAGVTNVSDYFAQLPQNFGGGASPESSVAGSAAGAGAAGINLRGLGNEATLVLLNGRRLAPGGLVGTFFDVSAIPLSAIERIEVVPDGASAIYGSDAIAGVANIILRRDFTGFETRTALSTPTEGKSGGVSVGHTYGYSDKGLSALITYQYSYEDELDSREKSYASGLLDPTTLLPSSRRNSVFGSLSYTISPEVEVTLDGYYNTRTSKGTRSSIAVIPIEQRQRIEVDQAGLASTIRVGLSNNWRADITGAYSRSRQDQYLFDRPRVNPENLSESIANVVSGDVSVGGPLFRIGSAPTRLVVGGHVRREAIDQFSIFFPSANVEFDRTASRTVNALFAEIFTPLVTADQKYPFIAELSLSGAVRYEDYSDVGSTVNPSLGIHWSPIEDISVRATYGKSFRAARLDQLVDNYVANLGVYLDPSSPSGRATALALYGNTSDLQPEKADVWTAGVDVTPDVLPGLSLHGTYFDIRYRGRLGTPPIEFTITPAREFFLRDFKGVLRRDLSREEVRSLVSGASQFNNIAKFFPALGSLSLDDVSIILDIRLQNLLSSFVSGADFGATYSFASSIGDWSASVSGTLLTSVKQRTSPSSPQINLISTYGNPVDLRLRAGVQWRSDAVAASLSYNFVDDYLDDEFTPGKRIDLFRTVDASLRFSIGARSSIVLSATNLFDVSPPLIGASRARDAVYDAANADPQGRIIKLLMTLVW